MTVKPFHRRQGELLCEDVSLSDLARDYGTPLYVYSRAAIESTFKAYQTALSDQPHIICYAVKANSNLAVLDCLARLGAGFDIVSGGELQRVLAAGGDPGKVVFSGVCKTPAEIRLALHHNIRCFNVESEAELEALAEVAQAEGKIAPISIRVNPDVDPQTHPYISTGLKENKFGVEGDVALSLYQRALHLEGVAPVGIDCHIGSQLTTIQPFCDSLSRLLTLVEQIEAMGVSLQHIDVGGGLGVNYGSDAVPPVADYIAALRGGLGGRQIELVLEPGRSIVAMAGVMLTQVHYLKPTPHRNFALVDGAMNDLLRPSLYGAWQDIVPVSESAAAPQLWDVVGPVCETGDFLGKDRELALQPGDLLAVTGSGAYGFTMASNYNSRPRAAELMVDGTNVHLIRARETTEQLWSGESCLPPAAP